MISVIPNYSAETLYKELINIIGGEIKNEEMCKHLPIVFKIDKEEIGASYIITMSALVALASNGIFITEHLYYYNISGTLYQFLKAIRNGVNRYWIADTIISEIRKYGEYVSNTEFVDDGMLEERYLLTEYGYNKPLQDKMTPMFNIINSNIDLLESLRKTDSGMTVDIFKHLRFTFVIDESVIEAYKLNSHTIQCTKIGEYLDLGNIYREYIITDTFENIMCYDSNKIQIQELQDYIMGIVSTEIDDSAAAYYNKLFNKNQSDLWEDVD